MSAPANELSSLISAYLADIRSYYGYEGGTVSHHDRIQTTARFIRTRLAGMGDQNSSIDQEALDGLVIALRHSSSYEGLFYNLPFAEAILTLLEAIGDDSEADAIERVMLIMTQPLKARAWAAVRGIRERLASQPAARVLLRPADLDPNDTLLRPAGGAETCIEDLLRPAGTAEVESV